MQMQAHFAERHVEKHFRRLMVVVGETVAIEDDVEFGA
jgi:hypothetical protein